MRPSPRGVLSIGTLLMMLLVIGGCGNSASTDQPAQGPPGGFGKGGPPMGPGGPGASGPIHDLMQKLGSGPQALTTVIGQELQANPPAWDAIQPKTKEYVELASQLGKHEPPRGSKESWSKLTAAYAESAVALNKAAESKDRDAALAAHKVIAGSCTACHREHRPQRGPGGMGGGMGGFPGGFPGGMAPPSPPGKVLSPAMQDRLKLSDEQKKQVDALQKDVDDRLDKILTDEQKKQLKEPAPGPGGFPGGGFPGGPRAKQ